MEKKTTGAKSVKLRKMICELLHLLGCVGVPMGATDRRNERMAMACMAVGGIVKSFANVKSADDGFFLTTREIIAFENNNFGENISPGSYDDIRRKDLIYLVQAGVVLNSASLDVQATNNPTRGYALNPMFAAVLRAYGTPEIERAIEYYKEWHIRLDEELAHNRDLRKIPVTLPSGVGLNLSEGSHNKLQKAIIEEFLSRFGMNAQVLYVGDTSNKLLYVDADSLSRVGFFELEHEELPDVVAYSADKNLLFLIEAVHSTGPMDEIRVRKLKARLNGCNATCVFITAFLNRKDFRKWVSEIAWETEVWIADSPDHMIHFNGYKFLEIHS